MDLSSEPESSSAISALCQRNSHVLPTRYLTGLPRHRAAEWRVISRAPRRSRALLSTEWDEARMGLGVGESSGTNTARRLVYSHIVIFFSSTRSRSVHLVLSLKGEKIRASPTASLNRYQIDNLGTRFLRAVFERRRSPDAIF
jgi:hypothetical protein